MSAHGVAERLIDWSKADGTTLLCTSLLDEMSTRTEGTSLQISTLADTWIHLNYLVQAALLVRTTKSREGELSRGRMRMEELRGADAAVPGRK